MKKILITLLLGLTLQGCSGFGDFTLVYKPVIQQGNIITPEMVAALETGMSKRQVRFVLGTPTLVDIFHQDRWDYTFTMKLRNQPIEIKKFSLFFAGDTLLSYQGDIKPAEDLETLQDKKEIMVSVPDYIGDTGILGQIEEGNALDLLEQ